MKKIAAVTLIALSLAGCGVLTTAADTGSLTTTSTAQASLYKLMGLTDTDASASADVVAGEQSDARLSLQEMLFDLLDTNADGSIPQDEFSAAIKAHSSSATDTQLAAMFKQLDADADGALTLEDLQPEVGASDEMGGPEEMGGREEGCRGPREEGRRQPPRHRARRGHGGHRGAPPPMPGASGSVPASDSVPATESV